MELCIKPFRFEATPIVRKSGGLKVRPWFVPTESAAREHHVCYWEPACDPAMTTLGAEQTSERQAIHDRWRCSRSPRPG